MRVVSENAKLTKVMLVMVCSICYLENNSLENSNRVKAAYARDRKAHIYGIINILLGKKKRQYQYNFTRVKKTEKHPMVFRLAPRLHRVVG